MKFKFHWEFFLFFFFLKKEKGKKENKKKYAPTEKEDISWMNVFDRQEIGWQTLTA